jgi:hypothetical protein
MAAGRNTSALSYYFQRRIKLSASCGSPSAAPLSTIDLVRQERLR